MDSSGRGDITRGKHVPRNRIRTALLGLGT